MADPPPYGNVWAERILLECIVVYMLHLFFQIKPRHRQSFWSTERRSVCSMSWRRVPSMRRSVKPLQMTWVLSNPYCKATGIYFQKCLYKSARDKYEIKTQNTKTTLRPLTTSETMQWKLFLTSGCSLVTELSNIDFDAQENLLVVTELYWARSIECLSLYYRHTFWFT